MNYLVDTHYLIWQCMQQDLLFLTADADIAKYSSLGLSLA